LDEVPAHGEVTRKEGEAMSVYVVAQISIHDRSRYDRYVAGFMHVLAGFEGRLLAADEAPAVVEGTWPYQKVILLEFPDRPAFERWASSPQYTEISKDRIAATTGCVLLVAGIPGS
jgi:uncharacterized protein (DUF1330 family)